MKQFVTWTQRSREGVITTAFIDAGKRVELYNTC